MNCFEEFKKIVASKVKNANEITMDSNLKDLGLDSLDLLEIVTDGEEVLNVHFEDEELLSFKTIGDVVNCAQNKLK
jgi:acyl carrier protein